MNPMLYQLSYFAQTTIKTEGLEPPISYTQNRRVSQLRYVSKYPTTFTYNSVQVDFEKILQ